MDTVTRMASGDDPQRPPRAMVTYDVGELLDVMRRETAAALARIETKLDTKADKSDVVELRKDLEHHSERLGRLETQDMTRQAAQSAQSHAVETITQRRIRIRETIYAFLTLLLTVGLVLGAIGVHI